MRNAAVAVLAAACLLACTELCRAQLCSDCECLPEPRSHQLCARKESSGKYRGFRSRCELDCINRCHKDKYVFVASRRCGQYLASLKGGSASPAAAATTAAHIPAESSVFGPLLNLLLQAAPSG